MLCPDPALRLYKKEMMPLYMRKKVGRFKHRMKERIKICKEDLISNNDIALPLETLGKKLFENCFMSSDDIETGGFVDAMTQILVHLYGNLDDMNEFKSMCNEIDGKSASDIDPIFAVELFNEFMRLVNNKR